MLRLASVLPRMQTDRAPPVPIAAPVLLDVTRLVELRWTGRQPNGIDRVCLEYLRHFAPDARAVVQHLGVIRVLGRRASRGLFALLASPTRGVRASIAARLAGALAAPRRPRRGSLYLNVSHTDFDLATHARWIERYALRAVYLLHDLIPIRHPDLCRPHAVRRHTGRVRAALRHASGIIAGTEAVAADLSDYAERCGLDRPPVVVAQLAGARLAVDEAPTNDPGDYLLCVGTIESRKNHALLLAVWERLHARLGSATPRLVIVGRWGAGSDPVRAALAASDLPIDVYTDCSDDALASLMRDARALLMPSLAEGFGLPVVEALAMGVPVVASDLPCLREIGQGVPCLLDPHDVAAWEARILALDAAGSRRQRRIDALQGYRPPTWDAHFARLAPWLTALAASPARGHAGPSPRPTPIDLEARTPCRPT